MSAHLATAVRLRHAGRDGAREVRFRRGKIDGPAPDVETDALGLLAQAVDRVEAIRGDRTGAAARTLARWPSRVDARFTLVAEVSTRGADYLVVRRNPPAQIPVAELSDRERQVVTYLIAGRSHKVVAYELGIALDGSRARFSRDGEARRRVARRPARPLHAGLSRLHALGPLLASFAPAAKPRFLTSRGSPRAAPRAKCLRSRA